MTLRRSAANTGITPQTLPPPSEMAPGRNLASLDGLRAVSILAVILGHLSGTHGFPRLDLKIGDYAHLGVVVFFVISGFLITHLLLAEYQKNGRVSLKLFYARRALRIFPPCYAYIGCLALLVAGGALHLSAADFCYAVTYTVNCQPAAPWQIGHLWSLAVEEQFYLLWPCAFVLLGPRRAPWFATGLVLLAPAARVAARLLLRGSAYQELNLFPMVADSLAMGCLLAWARPWLETQRWYRELFRPGYALGMLALLLILNRFMGYTVVSVFGTSLLNVCLAVLIHRSVYRSGDAMGRLLNWRPLAFLGVLSYSLYLWQQLFINRQSAAWMNAFPQNLVFAVAAALASYFLLEKPLLKMRHLLRA